MEKSKRKKVFYINCSPAGSTGKIITDTAEEIKKSGWDSCFCFPSGEAKSGIFEKIYKTSLPFEQGILRRITEMTGDSFGFAPVSTARIISALKKEKPDVVFMCGDFVDDNGGLQRVFCPLHHHASLFKRKDDAVQPCRVAVETITHLHPRAWTKASAGDVNFVPPRPCAANGLADARDDKANPDKREDKHKELVERPVVPRP